MNESVVQLRGVSKEIDETFAIRDVDLEIHQGQLVAFLGPTGAGRTSLFNLILGLSTPDHGEVKLFDSSPRDLETLQRVGATPANTSFPDDLRVHEIVEFVAAHLPGQMMVDELLDEFDLTAYRDRKAGTLNRGEERWLAVALAFAGKPDAVVLAFPTAAMDFDWRANLWSYLRKYVDDRNGTVLISTESTDLVRDFADQIVILRDGRIFASGSVDEIIDKGATHKLQQDGKEPSDENVSAYQSELEQAVYRLIRDDDMP